MPNEDKFDVARMDPTSQITKGEIPTVAADYAKVMTDHDSELCTFMFFQKHPNPKKESGIITLTSISEEEILEVKMPMTTAFALAKYMNALLKEMQTKPMSRTRIDFGPAAIKQVRKDDKK